MSLRAIAFDERHAAAWEGICERAVNATFQHTRRFLAYHGRRFADQSVLLLAGDEPVGAFPAASDPQDPRVVVSHPGATYGGVVHDGRLVGSRMIEAVAALASHYRDAGLRRLLYKALPHIYMTAPAQDDLYALFRHGAQRVRCDLSCAIDLAHRLPASERRRRGARKATRSVAISADPAQLHPYWSVLTSNLQDRHGARPVHTLDELLLLRERFPSRILTRTALIEGHVQAGVVFFNCDRVWHAQYIASSEEGQRACALDALFEAAILEARECGARFFDFGISNEQQGRALNDGLYRFKSEFGGGGVVHEFFELELATG